MLRSPLIRATPMPSSNALQKYLDTERLPRAMIETIDSAYRPLARHIADRTVDVQRRPFVLGLCGPQGSGKSTLAGLLRILFEETGLSAVTLSIDDFYLTRAERTELAERVHPLLVTRGVPGTHDVALAMRTLDALGSTGAIALPSFDKARDDRAPEEQWAHVTAPVDVVILEGWCVGAIAQDDAVLPEPINDLERNEDRDGRWRRHVNERLRDDYRGLFGRLDLLLMLHADSFERVYEWRAEQERKLRERLERDGRSSDRVMNDAQLRRFISHYERLTRHILAEMPHRANIVIELDAARRPKRVIQRPATRP
jgi:D-glycerate 3-kinase